MMGTQEQKYLQEKSFKMLLRSKIKLSENILRPLIGSWNNSEAARSEEEGYIKTFNR